MPIDITPIPPESPVSSNRKRCSRAWELVQTQPKGTRRFAFTIRQIAAQTGVSARTVSSMRELDKIMRDRGERPTGRWSEDRRQAACRPLQRAVADLPC